MAGSLYDRIGTGYRAGRGPDPRIAAMIEAGLEGTESVLNVGAGTGSYEPTDRPVIALDASMTMIAQRPKGAAPCVQGHAETLPFADGSFDAATAFLTYHHWNSVFDGLAELRRVARDRIVMLTWDPAGAEALWISRDYIPENMDYDRAIFPPLTDIAAALGDASVSTVPIPHDCTDGFLGAYWRRPHVYLDPEAQMGISTFQRIPEPAIQRGLAKLRADLDSGAWEAKYGDLLSLDSLDLGYRLIVART